MVISIFKISFFYCIWLPCMFAFPEYSTKSFKWQEYSSKCHNSKGCTLPIRENKYTVSPRCHNQNQPAQLKFQILKTQRKLLITNYFRLYSNFFLQLILVKSIICLWETQIQNNHLFFCL